MKVGNHGNNLSTSKEFIEKVSPMAAIITSGVDDNYPHSGTIKRLEQKDINIYRTDKNGIISIITDGKSLKILTQYDNNKGRGKP